MWMRAFYECICFLVQKEGRAWMNKNLVKRKKDRETNVKRQRQQERAKQQEFVKRNKETRNEKRTVETKYTSR